MPRFKMMDSDDLDFLFMQRSVQNPTVVCLQGRFQPYRSIWNTVT